MGWESKHGLVFMLFRKETSVEENRVILLQDKGEWTGELAALSE